MNLSLERLLYDPAAASEGPNVGSFVRAGDDGTAIGHVGDSLKVDISNTDFDIRDLSHTQDSVKVGDGVDFLAVNGDGTIGVVATATDFDIRDLTHVSDSIKVGDGTDFLAVNADGSINVNLTDDGIADDAVDSGNPFKVGSRAYGGALLSAISASGDRADLLSDMYRRVFMNGAANVGNLSQAISVTTTATALPAAGLAGRTMIMIQNNSNKDIYVGHSGVTTSNGIKVSKGSTMSVEAGQYNIPYAIVASGTSDVRVWELG